MSTPCQRAACPPPGRRPAFSRLPHDRLPECPRSSAWSGDTMGWRFTAPLDVFVRCGSWPERSFCSPQGISGHGAAGVVCGTEDHLPSRCCQRSEAFWDKRVYKLAVKCGHAHAFTLMRVPAWTAAVFLRCVIRSQPGAAPDSSGRGVPTSRPAGQPAGLART